MKLEDIIKDLNDLTFDDLDLVIASARSLQEQKADKFKELYRAIIDNIKTLQVHFPNSKLFVKDNFGSWIDLLALDVSNVESIF